MTVKLALLRSGETIISDIKELISDDKPFGYLLNDPQLVTIKKEMINSENPEEQNLNRGEVHVSLTPWLILSTDKQFPIDCSNVVTLAEPVESLKKMYEDKVNV